MRSKRFVTKLAFRCEYKRLQSVSKSLTMIQECYGGIIHGTLSKQFLLLASSKLLLLQFRDHVYRRVCGVTCTDIKDGGRGGRL